MAKLFVEDLEVTGKRVIMRVDFNVPLKDGVVQSEKRLKASLPTIQYLVEKKAKLILMSHLGRPKGKVNETMRMAPVAKALEALLGKPVKSIPVCQGPEAESAVAALKEGEILLLENLRFHAEEEGNDPVFAQNLAKLADIYVNDAFGTAHRAHASTEGITRFFKQNACGYLMKKELDFLGDALRSPKRPFVAVIGGAKISGKIDVIEALLDKVDHLIIGGGMVYTFLKAQGLEIGNSLLESDRVEMAKSLLVKGKDKIVLPTDSQVTTKLDFDNRTVEPIRTVSVSAIPVGTEGVDIGPESIKKFSSIVSSAGTVIWNGPMGVFEIPETAVGTFEIAKALVTATEKGGITVIGGGDSASAIEKAGLSKKVSHVSTGGGASLEYLEGKQLPGVVALTDK